MELTAFVEGKAFEKAILSYEKGLDWRELFDLALRIEIPQEEVVSTGYRVAGMANFLQRQVIDIALRGFGCEETIFRGSTSSTGLLRRSERIYRHTRAGQFLF